MDKAWGEPEMVARVSFRTDCMMVWSALWVGLSALDFLTADDLGLRPKLVRVGPSVLKSGLL
jgi:hypothetical protein